MSDPPPESTSDSTIEPADHLGSTAANPTSADQLLPPVEAPNPGFILQLFVVPAVIVSVIVVIWLLLQWIARSSDDPSVYFESLKRSGPSRWQAAANLADALRGPRHEEFKHDRAAAGKLAEILEEQIDAQMKEEFMEENPVTLRIFLCARSESSMSMRDCPFYCEPRKPTTTPWPRINYPK